DLDNTTPLLGRRRLDPPRIDVVGFSVLQVMREPERASDGDPATQAAVRQRLQALARGLGDLEGAFRAHHRGAILAPRPAGVKESPPHTSLLALWLGDRQPTGDRAAEGERLLDRERS